MGRLGFERLLDCFSLSNSSSSCLRIDSMEAEDEDCVERKSLIGSQGDQMMKHIEILEPKTVVTLRVSMHCNGCARKVQKHIRKMEGVTSLEVDLESKKVVVMGNIIPFEVLESVSKIKFAELWVGPHQSS